MKSSRNPVSPVTRSECVEVEDVLDSRDIIKAYLKAGIDVSSYFAGFDTISIYKCNDTGYRFFFRRAFRRQPIL